MTDRFDNDLNYLIALYGSERISRAIQPVILETGETTLLAVVADKEFYKSLSEFQKTTLIEAHMRLYWDEDKPPREGIIWDGLLKMKHFN